MYKPTQSFLKLSSDLPAPCAAAEQLAGGLLRWFLHRPARPPAPFCLSLLFHPGRRGEKTHTQRAQPQQQHKPQPPKTCFEQKALQIAPALCRGIKITIKAAHKRSRSDNIQCLWRGVGACHPKHCCQRPPAKHLYSGCA